MPQLLKDIFEPRMERYTYIRSEDAVNSGDRLAVLRMLENAGVERACVLKPDSPHKYVHMLIPSAQ